MRSKECYDNGYFLSTLLFLMKFLAKKNISLYFFIPKICTLVIIFCTQKFKAQVRIHHFVSVKNKRSSLTNRKAVLLM